MQGTTIDGDEEEDEDEDGEFLPMMMMMMMTNKHNDLKNLINEKI